MTTQPDRNKQFEAAAEKTAPASDFTPEALKREIAETAAEKLDQTPQQFLRKTATDLPAPMTGADTSVVESLDESSRVLPDFAAGTGESGKGRYEMAGQVGKGATSRVYAVRDRSLNRTIAAKFLRAAGGAGAGRQRFLHEARVTAMLEHPGITPIHDIGLSRDGHLYFTMKNVVGGTLGDAIRAMRDGGAPPPELRTPAGTVRVFLKLCDALAYAHHRGFVHQDIKPDNIMLGEFGEVLLLDWGSALAMLEGEGSGGRAMYGHTCLHEPGAGPARAIGRAQRRVLPGGHHVPRAHTSAPDLVGEPGRVLGQEAPGRDRPAARRGPPSSPPAADGYRDERARDPARAALRVGRRVCRRTQALAGGAGRERLP